MASKFYDAQGEVTAPTPVKSGAVPVWDPDTSSLRAVDQETAKVLANQGYEIGAPAQGHAIRDSATYKLAGFAAKAGEAGSMGLSNLASLAAGNQTGVREVASFDNEHPYISAAGSLLGYGASYTKGAGTLGAGLAQKLGSTTTRSALAHLLLPGTAAAATEGVADELTHDALMRDPVNLEHMAWSAMSNVLWNAGANALGYSIGALPKYLRSKTGSAIDFLERKGFVNYKQVKEAGPVSSEPRLTRATYSSERGFEHVADEQNLLRKESVDDVKDRLQTEQYASATIKHAEAEATEGSTKTTSATKTGSSTTTRGGEAVAAPIEGLAIEPKEVKQVFSFPDNYSKKDKLTALRKLQKHILGEDPTHLQMWDEVQSLEQEIQKYDGAVKRKELDADKVAPIRTGLIRQKQEYKDFLAEAVPRKVVDGKATPGFADINEEYARVSGNNYHDIAEPAFGPAIPKAKTNAPVVKTNEQFSSGAVDTSKFKKSFSDASTVTSTDRVKADTSVRDYDKVVEQARSSSKDVERGKEKYTATYVFPKTPPTFRKGEVKMPFSPMAIAAAAAPALLPFGHLVAGPAVAAMSTANVLTKAINYREPAGRGAEALGNYLSKYATPTLRTAIGTYGMRGSYQPKDNAPVNVADYSRAVQVLNAAASNPEAIRAQLEKQAPGLHEHYPEAAAKILNTHIRAAKALNDATPKRPYAPSLRDTDFKPTRAQQHRMLSRWQIMANPQRALETGDPQTLQILRDTYPAWYEQQSQKLMADTQSHKGPIPPHVARNITAFTGAAVTPGNNAAALKRRQQTAGPLPPQDAGQLGQSSPKIGGGPQSTKTATAAAQRDNPSFELN